MSKRFAIYHGDCEDVMKKFPDNYVHAIVTDPPYGLRFMGKQWDYDVPSVEVWRACLRMLKPGGHLLAFSGTRTYHRMVVNIEDGGFEIRDMIGWIYGSGFPKSLDVAKKIDQKAGVQREVLGTRQPRYQWYPSWDRSIAAPDILITAPATEAAKQWDGWGTGLKPAHEPICLARKPLDGTVAANVLAHSTGALNIEACRVGTEKRYNPPATPGCTFMSPQSQDEYGRETTGRWPANLIHDGSEEVLKVFPQTGPSNERMSEDKDMQAATWSLGRLGTPRRGHADDGGSAARFFYSAKASQKDRGEGNKHPTVKPVDLMCYLCRLVTPPKGIVLDPFMGSGSTGKAAILEGLRFIGIELDEQDCRTAIQRLKQAVGLWKEPKLTTLGF